MWRTRYNPAAPRRLRQVEGGLIYHVLNRAAGRRCSSRSRRTTKRLTGDRKETVCANPACTARFTALWDPLALSVWPARKTMTLECLPAAARDAHSVVDVISRHGRDRAKCIKAGSKSFPVQSDETFLTVRVMWYVQSGAATQSNERKLAAGRVCWHRLPVRHRELGEPLADTMPADGLVA